MLPLLDKWDASGKKGLIECLFEKNNVLLENQRNKVNVKSSMRLRLFAPIPQHKTYEKDA